MKIKSLFAMGLSLCAMVILTTACSDYDGSYDITHEMVLQNYENNFIERYGQPDPNHDWGFGKYTRAYGNGMPSAIETRATYVNKNQWMTATDAEGNLKMLYIPGHTETTPEGYYQYSNTGGSNITYMNTPNNDWTNYIPAGDVTDEEIAYVSWWFRTHPNLTKAPLPTQNFFIHMLSSDCDRYQDGTRNNKSRVEHMEWTDSQHRLDNYRWVKENENEPSFEMDLLQVKDSQGVWNDFNNVNGGNSNPLRYTEKLSMMSIEGSENTNNKVVLTQEQSKELCDEIGHKDNRLVDFYVLMDMTGDATNIAHNVHCNSSNGELTNPAHELINGSKENDLWALVHLKFQINGHDYDGWYLGFDYDLRKVSNEAMVYTYYGRETFDNGYHNGETWVNFDETGKKYGQKREIHERDYYYSNWIFKITPATYVGVPSTDPDDVGYAVYYKYKDPVSGVVTELAERTVGKGHKDDVVDLIAKEKDGANGTRVIVKDGVTYIAERSADQLTLSEEENSYTFWYNKDDGTTTEEPKKAKINIEYWEISKSDYKTELQMLVQYVNVAQPEVGTTYKSDDITSKWSTVEKDGVTYTVWLGDPALDSEHKKSVYIESDGTYTIKFYYTAPDPEKEYANYITKYYDYDTKSEIQQSSLKTAEVGTEVTEGPITISGYDYFYCSDEVSTITIEKNGENVLKFYYKQTPVDDGNTIRVFCEDLGSTSDFDFNDIVFDATFNDNGTITIQPLAAGGTLPIYVGGQNTEWHEMFGQTKEGSLYIPINVNANSQWDGKTAEPFTVSGTYIEDVKIVVGDINNPDSKTWEITNANYHTNDGTHVPQMIGVKYQSTRWTKESQQIEDAYGKFKTWVGDKDFKNWYETITNSGLLY